MSRDSERGHQMNRTDKGQNSHSSKQTEQEKNQQVANRMNEGSTHNLVRRDRARDGLADRKQKKRGTALTIW